MSEKKVILTDRIKELSRSEGTGAFTLDGAATGFSAFGDFYEYNDAVFYAATNGEFYEVGSGQYIFQGGENKLTRFPFRSSQIQSGPYYLLATSNAGSTDGLNGYFYPLYLNESSAKAVTDATSAHEHTFTEFPGVTFYMPSNHLGHPGATDLNAASRSGGNYATSGNPIDFDDGIKEIFVTYPGKYSVYTGFGLEGLKEPRASGLAFWANEQILCYDNNLVWNPSSDRLGITQTNPQYALDIGGSKGYSQIRASGFIDGGSGIMFSGGTAMPYRADALTASGGRQYEPFRRNELDNTTGTDAVLALSGVVDQRILFRKQPEGMVLAGPPSGSCSVDCDPDYPTFRYLTVNDVPFSDAYIRQHNDDDPNQNGAIALYKESGVIKYDNHFLFRDDTKRLGVNTYSPNATLDVFGSLWASGLAYFGGNVVVNYRLTVDADGSAGISTFGGAVAFQDTVQFGEDVEFYGTITDYSQSTFNFQKFVGVSGEINQLLLNSGIAFSATSSGIDFPDGTKISGAYQAGSGLEIHRSSSNHGPEFNIGNVFQVADNTYTTGYVHQDYLLSLSGVTGVATAFTTNTNENSGLLTIDASPVSGWAKAYIDTAVISAGAFTKFSMSDGEHLPSAANEITNTEVVNISGASGIATFYNTGTNSLEINPSGLSGVLEGIIDNVSGWTDRKLVGLSAAGFKVSDGTIIGETISTNEILHISGVSGISTHWNFTDNILEINPSGLSGILDNKIDAVSGWASALNAVGGMTYGAGSGITKIDNTFHITDGSGNLEHLLFNDDQIRIGTGAGDSFDLGDAGTNWTAIGYQAGYGASGNDTTNIIGYQAGAWSSGNDFCNFFGHQAGMTATGIQRSNCIGQAAGNRAFASSASTGRWNNFIGNNAGEQAYNPEHVNAIGSQAGYKSTGCMAVNMIGSYAGYESSENDHAQLIGYSAGFQSSGNSYITMLGSGAGYGAVSLNTSNLIGNQAGYQAIHSTGTDMIGDRAGYQSQYSVGSVMIGSLAGYQSSGMNLGVMAGPRAGYKAVGAELLGNPLGTYTNMIGVSAGEESSGCLSSNMMGMWAGYKASGCTYTDMIGWGAGREAVQCDNSIMIGRAAGYSSNDADNNIFMGYQAGYNSMSDYSIYIGYNAGANRTAGNALILKTSSTVSNNGVDWAENTQAGVIGIADIIYGVSDGTTKTLRIGAEPSTVSKLTNRALSVASEESNDITLTLIPKDTQTASTLTTAGEGGVNIQEIITSAGYLRIPYVTDSSSALTALSAVTAGEGVVAAVSVAGTNYLAVSLGSQWYKLPDALQLIT